MNKQEKEYISKIIKTKGHVCSNMRDYTLQCSKCPLNPTREHEVLIPCVGHKVMISYSDQRYKKAKRLALKYVLKELINDNN